MARGESNASVGEAPHNFSVRAPQMPVDASALKPPHLPSPLNPTHQRALTSRHALTIVTAKVLPCAMNSRRFPPPWSAEVQPNHYVVRDANRNGDPGGDEAVFNATPGSFWTNVKVGRLQAAALP